MKPDDLDLAVSAAIEMGLTKTIGRNAYAALLYGRRFGFAEYRRRFPKSSYYRYMRILERAGLLRSYERIRPYTRRKAVL